MLPCPQAEQRDDELTEKRQSKASFSPAVVLWDFTPRRMQLRQTSAMGRSIVGRRRFGLERERE